MTDDRIKMAYLITDISNTNGMLEPWINQFKFLVLVDWSSMNYFQFPYNSVVYKSYRVTNILPGFLANLIRGSTLNFGCTMNPLSMAMFSDTQLFSLEQSQISIVLNFPWNIKL